MKPRDVRAVVLAGGRGTRFWPLGRAARPKQFLSITGSDPMLLQTVRRIRPLVPPRRVTIIADGAQIRQARKLLPKLPKESFLVEPEARNTAPALMLATARVWLENPEAVVVVLPADHLIGDEAHVPAEGSGRASKPLPGRRPSSPSASRRRSPPPATATSATTGARAKG